MLGLQKKVEVESRELYHDRSVATRGTVDHAKRGNPPEWPAAKYGRLRHGDGGHGRADRRPEGVDVGYLLDSVAVLQRPAYLAIGGENLSPWSKRVTGQVDRLDALRGRSD